MLVRDPREISDTLVTALLDFCRRAGRPATQGEARLALARLAEDRDREILRIASKEPPARPLSPHAFVDWIEGMPAEQAAALEGSGAYLAVAREAAAEALELQLRREREAAAVSKPKPAPRGRRRRAEPTPLVRRRPRSAQPAEEKASTEPPREEVETTAPARRIRPGRRPAEPRFGRFVSGPPAKRPIHELEGPEGAEILRDLIAETKGAMSLLEERLNASWAPPQGEIGPDRIRDLLDHHGLEESRRRTERDQLRSLLRRYRGFDRPVARAWRITTSELRRLLAEYGLLEELKELRDRAREEVLAESRLEARLALLARQADRLRALGVYRNLDQEVLRELRHLVDEYPLSEESKTPEVLLEMIRRREGIDRSLWRWAVDHSGLVGAAAHRLGMPLKPRPRPGIRSAERTPRSGHRFGALPPRGTNLRPPRRDRGQPKR